MICQRGICHIDPSGFICVSGYDLDPDDDEEEDPDALNDPINQIDLQQYLTDFLQSLSRQPYYSQFTPHHNENEKNVLRTIGILV